MSCIWRPRGIHRRHALRRRGLYRGTERAVHPDLTYEHRWTPKELIVWDNRCVMHRATPYDPVTQGRVVRRCTVLGEIPV
jgi:taurine dioxygenase